MGDLSKAATLVRRAGSAEPCLTTGVDYLAAIVVETVGPASPIYRGISAVLLGVSMLTNGVEVPIIIR